MDANSLLESMRKEYAELGNAISFLERRVGTSTVASRKPKSGPRSHGRRWTKAMREAMSKRVRAALAAKRKRREARAKAAKPRVVKKAPAVATKKAA
jgi:hypothetical protein